jgi:hypothetical protein
MKVEKMSFLRGIVFVANVFVVMFFLSGLGFRPLPPEDNVESTLIWYKGSNFENYKYWTEALTEFLAGKFV